MLNYLKYLINLYFLNDLTLNNFLNVFVIYFYDIFVQLYYLNFHCFLRNYLYLISTDYFIRNFFFNYLM